VETIKQPSLLLRSKKKIKELQLNKEANKWKINCSKKVKMSKLLQIKTMEEPITIFQSFQTS
jgi:hypothetical protein